MIRALGIVCCLVVGINAQARDDGQWEDTSPQIRKWYRELMQPDNYNVSCCGEADAYWADNFETLGDQYIAIITDARVIPGRPHIDPGTRVVVPNHKLKYDAGNPTGHGVIFMNAIETVYCYVVPGGI